jgi:hypothetical protein
VLHLRLKGPHPFTDDGLMNAGSKYPNAWPSSRLIVVPGIGDAGGCPLQFHPPALWAKTDSTVARSVAPTQVRVEPLMDQTDDRSPAHGLARPP